MKVDISIDEYNHKKMKKYKHEHYALTYTGWANKNMPLCCCLSPVINWFSKFFHWHTLQRICN